MNTEVQFILSLCIAITVIIGVIRYRVIDPSYYPFFYLATISLFVEIMNYILAKSKMYDPVLIMMNLFYFTEFFFYTWLFHQWGLFNFKRTVFLLIIGSYFICWTVFTFGVGSITKQGFYFPVIYAITLLFFAVTTFNKLVIQDRGAIIKNPKFWILTGVIIFFSFYVLIESANLSVFGKNASQVLRRGLYGIVSYTNLIVNLMFATAALCIPRKKNFTKLF
jgi:hypothetical protein